MKRLTIKDYLKYRLGFALSPALLSTADACQYILDKHTGVDVAVAIYKSGKIAFRRRDGIDIDLRKVAGQFNGGGQAFAAGGVVGMDVSAEHWEDVLTKLDRTLKDYFLA
jgi:nanoRNase/pAp phosphatase (c-di-AMP/oligoRNAs hydrolase)